MDYIAGILEIIAIWITGDKNRWGWMLGVVCCFFWLGYVFMTGTAYGILIPTIPCLIINIRNFIKWSHKQPSAEEGDKMASDLEKENETDIQLLRRMLAFAYCGASLYADDGELQDNTMLPCIDFKRDEVPTIKAKMHQRATTFWNECHSGAEGGQ